MSPSPICALLKISDARLFVLTCGILLLHHGFVFTKGGRGPYGFFWSSSIVALSSLDLCPSNSSYPSSLHTDLCLPDSIIYLCFAQDPPPCTMLGWCLEVQRFKIVGPTPFVFPFAMISILYAACCIIPEQFFQSVLSSFLVVYCEGISLFPFTLSWSEAEFSVLLFVIV